MDRLELEVAPRPDELLDATCKRSIVQIVRIETKNPKGFCSGEEVGRSVRKNRAMKGQETCKSGCSDKAKI
jgi:hypothetical protein